MKKLSLSPLLISLSLLLLAGFLALWLRQSYRQELESVKKEGNVLFISTVRSLEGEYMQKLYRQEPLQRRTPAPPPDSVHVEVTRTLPVRLVRPMPDTAMQIVRVFGEKHELSVRDSQVNVFIKTDASGAVDTGDRRFVGSLAMMVALSEGRQLRPDSLFNVPADHALPEVLGSRLGEQIERAGLPVTFRVISWGDSTVIARDGLGSFRSDVYVDISSGERYAVEYSAFNAYVWRQLVPEILFAALLYGCVAMAFFAVHQNLRKQRRLAELKNDFINNVTHELKTPIATVSVAVEALRSFDAMQHPERADEYLDIAKNELTRLSILVDKVLKMSLFDQARAELKPEPVDLKALIDEVLASLRLQFERSGARVDFDVQGENFVLHGDRLHLTSVIYNLLDNALKYGGDAPEIQVGLAAADGQLRVEVRDRGIGIPDEYRDKIFDKFFRVPHGNVHNTRGHGLGLHYVAGVVRQHLGSIRAERNAGGPGTCFTVMLPQQ